MGFVVSQPTPQASSRILAWVPAAGMCCARWVLWGSCWCPLEPPGLLWCRSRVGTPLRSLDVLYLHASFLPASCSCGLQPCVEHLWRGPQILDVLFSFFVIVGAIFWRIFCVFKFSFLFTSQFEKSLCRVLRLIGSLAVFSLPSLGFSSVLFLAFLFGSFLESLIHGTNLFLRANHVSCP